MKECVKRAVFLFIFCMAALQVNAQNKTSLEKKKKQLEQEIRETNKLIEETKKDKTLSLTQLTILNKKIKDRQELIRIYNTEIGQLNGNIKNNDKEIDRLETEIKGLKENYALVLRKAYLNRGKYVPVVYLFAAESVNQAYRRLRYLQSYNEYRRKQAINIRATQEELSKKVAELRTDLDTKRVLLNNEQVQRGELDKEKNEKEKAVQNLSKKEKQLKKELEKKRANAKKLDAEIKKVIEAEIAIERKRAAASAAKTAAEKGEKAPAANVIKVSPETKLVSDKFESNKGRLPWPLDEGMITERFGTHKHPDMPGIIINNNGLNFATRKGSSMKAIFEGEVAAVFALPNGSKAVIVRHGEYLSVYANLSNAIVTQGSKVKVGQALGTIMTDEDEGKTEAHLELWKGKTILNPEDWIVR